MMKIEYSYLEVISFYQNLLKYVKELQSVINDKQKTKFKLFIQIEGILAKFPQLHKRTLILSTQNLALKKKIFNYEQIINNYKSREQTFIKKITKLESINNKFLESLSKFNQKDSPIHRLLKKGEDHQFIFKKLEIQKTKPDQQKINIFKYDQHNITELFASTRSVYNFFLKKLQVSDEQKQLETKKEKFQNILEIIESQNEQAKQYELTKVVQDLKKSISQIQLLKLSYEEYYSEKQKLRKKELSLIFNFEQLNAAFESLEKLLDKKSKLTKYKLSVLQNQKNKLRKIQFIEINSLKARIAQLLRQYDIISSIENYVKYENEIQQNFMIYKNAFKEVEINSSNHSQIINQSNVQLLKNTIKHEKKLIKSLAQFFIETDLKMTASKITFTQNLRLAEQQAKQKDTILRQKDQKIIELEKVIEEKKPAQTSFLDQQSVNISMSTSRRYNQYKLRQLQESKRQESRKIKKKHSLKLHKRQRQQSILEMDEILQQPPVQKKNRDSLKLCSSTVSQIILYQSPLQVIENQDAISNPSSFSFRERSDNIQLNEKSSKIVTNSNQFFLVHPENETQLVQSEDFRYGTKSLEITSVAEQYKHTIDQILSKIFQIKSLQANIKQNVVKIDNLKLNQLGEIPTIDYNQKKYNDINDLIQNQLITSIQQLLIPKFGNTGKIKKIPQVHIQQIRVNSKKKQEDEGELKKLMNQNQLIKNEIQIQKNEKQKINSQLILLKTDIQTLKQQNQILKSKQTNQILENQTKVKQILDKLIEIEKQKKMMEQQNDRLIEQNNEMSHKYKQYQQSYQNIKERQSKLNQIISNLTQENQDLKNELKNKQGRQNIKQNNIGESINYSSSKHEQKQEMSRYQIVDKHSQNVSGQEHKQNQQNHSEHIARLNKNQQIFDKFDKSKIERQFQQKIEQLKTRYQEQRQQLLKIIKNLKQQKKQLVNKLQQPSQWNNQDIQQSKFDKDGSVLKQLNFQQDNKVNSQMKTKLEEAQNELQIKNKELKQVLQQQNDYKERLNQVTQKYKRELKQHQQSQNKFLEQNRQVEDLKRKNIHQDSEYKLLLSQFKLLQQNNKNRIIKQQIYIKDLLKKKDIKIQVTENMKVFLQDMYLMHKKIQQQEKQIKQLLVDLEISKIEHLGQIESLKKLVMEYLKIKV